MTVRCELFDVLGKLHLISKQSLDMVKSSLGTWNIQMKKREIPGRLGSGEEVRVSASRVF